MANLRVTSPRVTAQWASLREPDKHGKYSIELLYDPSVPEHAAQLEEFEQLWADEYNRACAVARKKSLKCDKLPWRPQVVDEVETGLISLRVEQKASIVTRDNRTIEFSIAVKKADGKTPWDWDEDGLIGNGSVVRAVWDWNPHKGGPDSEFGLGRRLRAVQVIKHVPYDGGFGFEDETPEEETLEELELEAVAVNRGDDELPF